MVTEEDLKKLPDQPGVYIMHDIHDTIIYVGKAVSLRHRVRSYFQPSHDEGLKKAMMVQNINYFEYIVCDSELEALVLECNLIKEHRPKYNTMLRDDKTYPYIEITLGEDYPRVLFSRRQKKNNSKFFGPFTSAGSVKDTIDLVQKLYHIRTCARKFPESIGKERPCLNYHIGQCDGVCTGNVSKADYAKNIEKVIDFLNGNYKEIVEELTSKMQAASEEMDFEKAAEFRDLITSVKNCVLTQKATALDGEDRDIISLAHDDEDAVVSIFFVRNGKMIGRDHFFVNIKVNNTREEILEEFIEQYYAGTPFIPKEILLPIELEAQEVVEDWLSNKKGNRVYLKTPQRGNNHKLVQLAGKNAWMVLSQDKEKIKREEGRTIGALKEISDITGIPNINRMEAFDISNTSGYQSVGSMVVFEKGKPKRSDYRKFRLKTVDGPNDYASMKEVLTRRFTHGMAEMDDGADKDFDSFTRFPDVIMMDGGKGQVHIAQEVLKELNLSIPVCGMVKDDHHNTRGLFYNDTELPIDKASAGFALITRLQDEAHRFAITYHKSLRGKEQVHSFLDDIKGIGPKRRKMLMMKYASVDEMKEATVIELANVPGMNPEAAENLYNYLHT